MMMHANIMLQEVCLNEKALQEMMMVKVMDVDLPNKLIRIESEEIKYVTKDV